MDPLFVLGLVVLGAFYFGPRWFGSTARRNRTIELAPNVVVRISSEEQSAKALERNLAFQQIEIASYNKGEIGHELYGNRMASINRMPQSVRKPGQGLTLPD